jgi:hypothetical protein
MVDPDDVILPIQGLPVRIKRVELPGQLLDALTAIVRRATTRGGEPTDGV